MVFCTQKIVTDIKTKFVILIQNLNSLKKVVFYRYLNDNYFYLGREVITDTNDGKCL